jgi:FtsH-binding integral membrane protein
VTFQPNRGEGGLGQPVGASDGRPMAQPRRDPMATAVVQGAYLTQAFFWMFAGLLLTAGVATAVRLSATLQRVAIDNILVVIVAQLALVLVISFGIRRLNATAALGLFFVYAASLGLTIGVIVMAYTGASVATAFFSASAMFGGAALYGYTTKRSLATIGAYASMAVFGLIVAMLVNVFVGGSTFNLIISIVGVVLFTVLTAYHVQRIANGSLAVATGSVEKAAVIGALLLYLDFINLFLFLLRLLGGRR